ncbi:synaptotagmin-7-like isoform X2 [Tachypleus tridentatus]|uniref:synaptotagmin-7-like isoform X2 n=1 Tax=Tachypleus tridentatus TaxID=6853 RepID=UPI003FD4E6DA
MDLITVIVASVLGSLAVLITMGIGIFFCCFYWKKRRNKKSGPDEMEPLQVGKAPSGSKQGTGNETVKDLTRHNVEDRPQQTALRLLPPLPGSVTTQAVPLSDISGKEGTSGNNVGAISFLHSLLPSAEQQEAAADLAREMSEPDEPAGQIQFSLEYDIYSSLLTLKIIQAKGLPAKDITGTSDPYVRICLLPDKKHKLETKVKHRTLSPRWNETFYFEGYPLAKLQKSILYLHVFDYDRFSRDDPIGDVYLPLAQVDLSKKPTFWKCIRPAEDSKLGEILITLLYIPRTSELSITLVKARNLKAKDITGFSDPYVKVWLHRGEKRIEKKKTEVHKKTLDPIFNETFQFVVPWEHIRETSLAIIVMDFDTVGRNEAIGKVVLSSRSGPTEAKHWGDMLSKPRTPISQWHRLKTF